MELTTKVRNDFSYQIFTPLKIDFCHNIINFTNKLKQFKEYGCHPD